MAPIGRHEDDPWAIPVPVASSNFVALDRAHARCNVEVDLGSIGAFFSSPAKSIASADFQLLPDGNTRGRLGAGRAVFHAGRYLKGVGRTPLAANWRLDADRRHASGHLLPTAAVREYLVSRWLEAHGCADTIVACDGILLRPLPKGGRAAVARSLPRPFDEPMSPIDERFQAISVKKDGFARLSNYSWSLHHLEGLHRHIAESTLRFQSYLEGAPVAGADCTPRRFAEALVAGIDRGFANLRRYFAAGVTWGFVDNNFTADGRFLDLEVPIVLGGPTFGVLQAGATAQPLRSGSRFVGTDAFGYAHNLRLFVADTLARLRFLVASRALQNPLVRQFVAALAQEIEQALPPSHLARSARALLRWTEETIAGPLSLGAKGRRALRPILEARLRWTTESADVPLPETRLVTAPLKLAQYIPTTRLQFRHPEWAPPPDDAALARAQAWNDALMRVDQSRTIDAAFAALRSATRAITAG